MNTSRHLKQQQHATAQAGAGILRLAQSQRDKLATSFGDSQIFSLTALREQMLAESSNCGSPRRSADEMKFARAKSRLFLAKKVSAKCVTPSAMR